MLKTICLSCSIFVAAVLLAGCGDPNALTQKEKDSIKGGPPPADVWDKVGEAKANQPDRSKDYGTIPGESTTAPANVQTPGPSNR